ncbi:UNVERIFIED_CONTAM: hypothetical protein Scaly_3086600 [Sesamum calycinum]|uniref:Enhancer of polycomb-like protein n=1 Tax=Sesamum calycinum TaxID=2727403 RepID=A0AAW2JME2_9LAMI
MVIHGEMRCQTEHSTYTLIWYTNHLQRELDDYVTLLDTSSNHDASRYRVLASNNSTSVNTLKLRSALTVKISVTIVDSCSMQQWKRLESSFFVVSSYLLRQINELIVAAGGATSTRKETASEIPTPEFVVVDTYERDYSRTFIQPTSYLRARGARAEIGEFVEYDLDNEDEDWLQDFNKERKTLVAEK